MQEDYNKKTCYKFNKCNVTSKNKTNVNIFSFLSKSSLRDQTNGK